MTLEPAAEHPGGVRPVERRSSVPEAGALPSVLAIGIAVFTGGAVLLGVEIAASRVLAPYFGNSLFVWGALIGVVLAGLAVGYWAGGALADRVPSAGLLVGALSVGALLVLAIPVIDEPVLEAVLGWNAGARLNPLLSAVLLFGPMSVVLASVTPIAVRLRTRSVTSAGRTAGRLFSISTAGSIVGTFLTAFWLIPSFGTNELLGLAGTALLAAVAAVGLSERMLFVALAGAAAAVCAAVAVVALAPETGGTLSGAAAQNWSPVYVLRDKSATSELQGDGFRVVYSTDTRYHRLAVVDDEGSRYLRFDNSFQSGMYLSAPFRTRFRYTDFFHLGLAYNPRARNLLFVGLGGGSSPKRLWRDFPRLHLQVAELDPAVVEAAYRYFRLPRSPRLRVTVEDGRRFLVRSKRRWHVIAVDAFYADSIPFHLTTREFLELARTRLAPGGVIVTNVIGALRGPGSKLFRSIYRTYRAVFPTVLVHPVSLDGDDAETSHLNLILVAGAGAAPQRDYLTRRWGLVRKASPGVPSLDRPIRDRYDRTIPTGDVPTLTDDYAPTDALLLVDQ